MFHTTNQLSTSIGMRNDMLIIIDHTSSCLSINGLLRPDKNNCKHDKQNYNFAGCKNYMFLEKHRHFFVIFL
jgi:hypothetical protein